MSRLDRDQYAAFIDDCDDPSIIDIVIGHRTPCILLFLGLMTCTIGGLVFLVDGSRFDTLRNLPLLGVIAFGLGVLLLLAGIFVIIIYHIISGIKSKKEKIYSGSSVWYDEIPEYQDASADSDTDSSLEEWHPTSSSQLSFHESSTSSKLTFVSARDEFIDESFPILINSERSVTPKVHRTYGATRSS